MTLLHEFKREERLPSYFANRLQDFLSAARTDLRLTRKSNTEVEVAPAEPYGIAGIDLQGLWRFRDTAVTRVHPGGGAATYTVWAVGTKQKVVEVPKPFTDETDYKFDLRITDGKNPEGEGVEVFEKIGEIDWDGAKITALRQTYNAVTGPMIQDGALSNEGDITWAREPNGTWIPQLKANSVTAAEILNGAVGAAEIADALKPSVEAAAATEALRALGATGSTAAAGNDARLSDERTPKNNSVSTAKLVNLAVTTAKIAAEAIIEEHFSEESVAAWAIQALAIETAKIAALAVTEGKLAGEAVSTAKIAALAVTAAKLATEAVETGKIKNLAVTAAKLAASAVEESKIADGAVTSRKAKLTMGQISSNAKLTLTEAYQDVPGTELKITPSVASFMVVIAMFDFNTAVAGQSFGVLNVDGVDQANFAGGYQPSTTAQNHPQSWVVPLTAAAHTLKLRAKKGSGTIHCESGITGYFYLMVAS